MLFFLVFNTTVNLLNLNVNHGNNAENEYMVNLVSCK